MFDIVPCPAEAKEQAPVPCGKMFCGLLGHSIVEVLPGESPAIPCRINDTTEAYVF